MGSSVARLSRAVGDSRLVAVLLQKLGLGNEEEEEEGMHVHPQDDVEEARGEEERVVEASAVEPELTRYDLVPPGEDMPRSWKVPPALVLLAMYLPRRFSQAGSFFPWSQHARELQHVMTRRLSDGPFTGADRLEAHFRNMCLLHPREWSPEVWDFLPRVPGVLEAVSQQLQQLVQEVQDEARPGQGGSGGPAVDQQALSLVARALEHGWRVVVCPLAQQRAKSVPNV